MEWDFRSMDRSGRVELLIASGNAAKVRELREMLGQDRFNWHDLAEFRDLPAVEETGATFHDNACLKASGYALAAKMWALADDSGLEVDALSGEPGVNSARWAKMNGTAPGIWIIMRRCLGNFATFQANGGQGDLFVCWLWRIPTDRLF